MIAGIENENVSCDADHASFKDGMSSIGYDLTFYLWANFDDSSLNRFRDFIWDPKI